LLLLLLLLLQCTGNPKCQLTANKTGTLRGTVKNSKSVTSFEFKKSAAQSQARLSNATEFILTKIGTAIAEIDTPCVCNIGSSCDRNTQERDGGAKMLRR
jgi:hypothetical protein